MFVVIVLEIDELCFEVGSRPKQHPIQAFSAQRSDQSFHERMR